MTEVENKMRANDFTVQKLKTKICTKDSNVKGYVFISYKSDDWKLVLTQIVYTLVNKYHLNVYFDGSFDEHNDCWVEQFPSNMSCFKCKGVLAFIDNAYATSYATLMELMHSQCADSENNGKKLDIIPINIGPFNCELGEKQDEDTGLGNNEKMNYEEELKLFIHDYEELCKKPDISTDFKVYSEGKPLKKKICYKMVKALMSYSVNYYNEDTKDAFYRNIIQTIKNTFGDCVFSSTEETADLNSNLKQKVSEVKQKNSKSAKASRTKKTAKLYTYKIYGEEFTHNKSQMQLNIFNKVLERHEDAVEKILDIPEEPLLRAAAPIDFSKKENKYKGMPTRFLTGEYFKWGGGIFIGTGFNDDGRLKEIARLLKICGEDNSVFQSDSFTLPEIKTISRPKYHEKLNLNNFK